MEQRNDDTVSGGFYAVLNVSPDATNDEIRSAYKKLCLTYHPDRHKPALRDAASGRFKQINQAYRTLLDKQKRLVYDMYGMQGLEAGWDTQLGHQASTEEIQRLYQRLKEVQREHQRDQAFPIQGSVSIGVSATDFISPYDTWSRRLPEVTVMNMSSKMKWPLTEKQCISVSGSLLSRNGLGAGQLSTTFRHKMNERTWGEAAVIMGQRSALALQGSHRFSKRTNLQGGISIRSSGAVGLGIALQQQVGAGGAIIFQGSVGHPMTSVSGMWLRQLNNGKDSLECEAHINAVEAGMSVTYNRKVSAHQYMNVALKAGLDPVLDPKGGIVVSPELTLEIGSRRRVSSHTTASVSVGVGTHGIALNVGFRRGGYDLEVPIQLCDNLTPTWVMTAIAVPSLALIALRHLSNIVLYAMPSRTEEAKLAQKQELQTCRQEAEDAVRLMASEVKQRRAEEEVVRGLIIRRAIYGRVQRALRNLAREHRMPRDTDELCWGPGYVFVELQLQYHVDHSRLHLHGGMSKSGLLGCYDPCPGRRKQLYVEYEYRGRPHSVTVGDDETLFLPPDSGHLNPAGSNER